MAYIPKDAKWYVAEVVMECRIEGEPRNVVHVNILLVRAIHLKKLLRKQNKLVEKVKVHTSTAQIRKPFGSTVDCGT